MKVKVSEATNTQLNWLVAKIKGIPTELPKLLTYEEVKDLAVPFTLYGTVAIRSATDVRWEVEKITVVRCGIDFGCSAPSISFLDSKGNECRGSIADFHLTEEEAQKDAKVAELGDWRDYDFCEWPDGGPIIERERIDIYYNGEWNACLQSDQYGNPDYWSGPTPLIAATRCYVASELGDEVEVPDNLEEN